MLKGIEVLKHRETKGGKSVKRILYLTPNAKYLVCCRTKGQPEQKHMHLLARFVRPCWVPCVCYIMLIVLRHLRCSIHSVEHSYDKVTHFMVFGGKKGEDLLLELEVVTRAARDKLVIWLRRLVASGKEERKVAVTVELAQV